MKKAAYYIVLITISTMSLMFRCPAKEGPDCHKISIVNNSDKSIYINGPGFYPDTLFYGRYSPSALIANADFCKIEPYNSRKDIFFDCAENMFKVNHKGDRMLIAVIDGEYLEANLEYRLLKLYTVSLGDLRNSNWTLVYDPANP